MPYIVDGNNLLWASFGQRDVELSAAVMVGHCVRLLWAVSRYLQRTNEQAEVVFDGPEPADLSRFQHIPHITVWFAGPGRQADGWIEERLRSYKPDKPLTVVSSDRRLRQAAIQVHAGQIRSEAFWEQVLAAQTKETRPNEPPAKMEGLSQSETELWMRIFGIEEGP